MSENKKLRISLFLDKDLEEKFLKIKTKLGIKNNPDVVRYTIATVYDLGVGD